MGDLIYPRQLLTSKTLSGEVLRELKGKGFLSAPEINRKKLQMKKTLTKRINTRRIHGWTIFLLINLSPATLIANELAIPQSNVVELRAAVHIALMTDPWLVGNQHSQDAIEALSIAAGSLPDPKLSLGIANLPTDTFDVQQEAMTQSKIAVSQLFPRGNSRAIKRKQLEFMGAQYPYQRQDREAKIVTTVSQLWLDAYKAQESIVLIEKDRALFEQLADVAQATYSSAFGRTRQQDIVRADLELIQLEDRLTLLKQQQDIFQKRLSEWLNNFFADQYLKGDPNHHLEQPPGLTLVGKLPDIALLNPALMEKSTGMSQQLLAEHLIEHPSVKALDQKIQATSIGIDLAKQKYKPEWSINASYGYRDEDLFGRERADLFSLGVTFDLPLFTAHRQDKELQAATSQAESVKTEKWLLLRNMMASFESLRVQLERLDDRKKLYRSELLPQMHIQAEASLTAYTNDDGDFAEAVRARIAVLNAEIEALSIEVDRQKVIAQLNYLFVNQQHGVEMMLNESATVLEGKIK